MKMIMVINDDDNNYNDSIKKNGKIIGKITIMPMMTMIRVSIIMTIKMLVIVL